MFQSFFSFLSFKDRPASNPLDSHVSSMSHRVDVQLDLDETSCEFNDDASSLRTSEYTHGQELSGWVLKVTPGGIVVTLPNTETGLVLRDEVCWPGFPVHYKKGDWVDVVVVSFKPERGLGLSIRRAKTKERIRAVYATVRPGVVLEGRIKTVKDYGVFISIGPGVQGLCHVSRISDISKYGKHAIGQTLSVRVLEFDEANDRIALEIVE